jgi:hypothetical protein
MQSGKRDARSIVGLVLQGYPAFQQAIQVERDAALAADLVACGYIDAFKERRNQVVLE